MYQPDPTPTEAAALAQASALRGAAERLERALARRDNRAAILATATIEELNGGVRAAISHTSASSNVRLSDRVSVAELCAALRHCGIEVVVDAAGVVIGRSASAMRVAS